MENEWKKIEVLVKKGRSVWWLVKVGEKKLIMKEVREFWDERVSDFEEYVKK